MHLRAVAVGLAAGTLSGLGRLHLTGTPEQLANSLSTWLVVPFLLGAFAANWRRAATAGAVAGLGQLAGFYAVTGAFESAGSVAFWVAGALGGGSLFGVAGHRRALLVLGRAFVIEGLVDTGPLWVATGVALGALSRRHATIPGCSTPR
ncbi:hypothetical protein DVA67_025725 [Solirubrobacter sp. CPCC 204708]|uniref:DUF6518 family protein n=1 Tax=Solirubrobacter deserti TaxID=2282478 RepID=A0ABT4RQQ3_9ACTN|nr:DUF6518 family protein [Solirubrobacter deserti]MBE2319401.1 hypothetical protein [Solirubrobacter deserti]MDA0140898.1 DUF6518 family protein [Solirubrobacter deserti]